MTRRPMLRSIATAVTLATVVACAPGDAANDSVAIGDTATALAAADTATTGAAACYLTVSPDEARSRPSPLGELRFSLGDAEALLCYGRPSANGRTVAGGLIPYGSPWRLGANEATAIHLPVAAEIGTVAVEPGTYSLYVVASAEQWEVFVNRQAERWGIPINEGVTSNNVGSFTVPVGQTASMVEQLEFTWVPQGDAAGNLVAQWENTRVEIPVRRR